MEYLDYVQQNHYENIIQISEKVNKEISQKYFNVDNDKLKTKKLLIDGDFPSLPQKKYKRWIYVTLSEIPDILYFNNKFK